MLAYTAVDGLRAISRDFDLDWQPDVHEDPIPVRRNWRTSLRGGQQALGTLLALLPLGAIAWQR
jgi:hypothetical protein